MATKAKAAKTRLWGLRDAARVAGVSYQILYRALRLNKLPPATVKVGRQVYWDAAALGEVIAYFEDRRRFKLS